MPRLVATDLDGTLLHSDGTVTERTRRALTAVEELGVTIVFVTGRPIRWMDDLRDHVGSHGLAICSNGGLVYDVHADRVSRTRPIDVELGLDVARLVRSAIPGSAFAIETPHGIAKEPHFMERYPVPPGTPVGELAGVFTEPAVKLLARHEDLDPEDFWTRVEREVGRLVTTTWSSVGALVEISAPGVTKASTLELVCAERGIGREEVVAFGDMPNDLPMLAWAGASYAMANAHPSVRELADHVAPAHDEDGVAVVLESLFGLSRGAQL